MRRIIAIAAACLVLLPASVFAKGQEEQILEQLKEMKQQLKTMQETYMTNNQEAASAISKAATVYDEFSGVKGQVDATTFQIQSQRDEMMRLINDLQNRLQGIEDQIGIFSDKVIEALSKASPQAAAEIKLYRQALKQVNSSDYLEAAATFQSFIQKYPKSDFAANAREWVAECFYSSRDYKRAIKEYQNYIEKYPKSSRTKTAMLKQGNSFYELRLPDEAKLFYDKVISTYPKSSEADIARAKLARIEGRKSSSQTAPQSLVPGQSSAKSGAPTQTPAIDDSQFGGYPGETIEQRRARMRGEVPAQTEDKNGAKDSKEKDSVLKRGF